MPAYGLYILFFFASSIHNQAAGEITLRLNGTAFYGQPFILVCFNYVNTSTQYAVFYRSLINSTDVHLTDNVATVTYLNSTCQATPSSYSKYSYSCHNEGKEITLTVPAENEAEHNTYWRCMNPGGTIIRNNNIVEVFVYVRITSVNLTWDGIPVNDSFLTVTPGVTVTFSCVATASRPDASFLWYIGSELKGAGHQLIFTPRSENHGQEIYCLAYNKDLDTAVSSQKIIMKVKGIPDKPTYFSTLYRTVSTIVLTWKPGNSDGYLQTFVIEGRYHDSINWKNMSVVSQFAGTHAAILEHLEPGGIYFFRMYAVTSVGNGDYTDNLNVTLLENDVSKQDCKEVIYTGTDVGPIVGAGIGGVVSGAAATVMILVLRRTYLAKKTKSQAERSHDAHPKAEDPYYNIPVAESPSEMKEIATQETVSSKSLQENYSRLSKPGNNENEYDKVQYIEN